MQCLRLPSTDEALRQPLSQSALKYEQFFPVHENCYRCAFHGFRQSELGLQNLFKRILWKQKTEPLLNQFTIMVALLNIVASG